MPKHPRFFSPGFLAFMHWEKNGAKPGHNTPIQVQNMWKLENADQNDSNRRAKKAKLARDITVQTG